MSQKVLSAAGKEDLALALILLKDFKAPGTVDLEVFRMVHGLAQFLEVDEEFNKLLTKLPPFKITTR